MGERVEQLLRENPLTLKGKPLRQRRLLAQNLTNLEKPDLHDTKETVESPIDSPIKADDEKNASYPSTMFNSPLKPSRFRVTMPRVDVPDAQFRLTHQQERDLETVDKDAVSKPKVVEESVNEVTVKDYLFDTEVPQIPVGRNQREIGYPMTTQYVRMEKSNKLGFIFNYNSALKSAVNRYEPKPNQPKATAA